MPIENLWKDNKVWWNDEKCAEIIYFFAQYSEGCASTMDKLQSSQLLHHSLNKMLPLIS
jgi:hypothetical protein